MKKKFNQSLLVSLLVSSAAGCVTGKDAIVGRWEFCTLVKWAEVGRMSDGGYLTYELQQTWETTGGLTILVNLNSPDKKDTTVGSVQKILVTR